MISHEVIVNLIANTATRQGFRIQAELDQRQYPTGTKVSAAERSDPTESTSRDQIPRRLELHDQAEAAEIAKIAAVIVRSVLSRRYVPAVMSYRF